MRRGPKLLTLGRFQPLRASDRHASCARVCGRQDASNAVDADDVPVPHFGIVLPMEEWKALADEAHRKRREVHHRAKDPIRRRGRRTGDDVLS